MPAGMVSTIRLLKERPRTPGAVQLVSIGLLATLMTGGLACESEESSPSKGSSLSPSTAPPEAEVPESLLDTEAGPTDSQASDSEQKRLAPVEAVEAIKKEKKAQIDTARVYAKSRFVWIRAIPNAKAQWIGFLWAGGSVKIRSGTQVPGAGCSGKWTPVEPRGYLCVDENRATLDGTDPDYLLLKAQGPRVDSAFPHNYAAVNAPLKRYQQPPKTEGVEFPALQHWPKGLSENRKKMVARSAFAFSDSFGADDNAFLLASDMTWVRKKDVELLPKSAYQGVELNNNLSLPLAFFPTAGRHSYRLNAAEQFIETERELPWHKTLALDATRKKIGRHTFYRLRNSEEWVRGKDAVIPEPRKTTPWGAPLPSIWQTKAEASAASKKSDAKRVVKKDSTTPAQAKETWMEASILGGWLIAYRGIEPVYATMISAGRGGRPHPGKKAIETASTPTGRFTINGKFKTASMNSSSTPIVHADVPWTQNFSGPHALHSAYWHDDFGKLKSAGCVNISPLDGKWLFEFSEPRVPEDWHGVRAIRRYGKPSTFIVHE